MNRTCNIYILLIYKCHQKAELTVSIPHAEEYTEGLSQVISFYSATKFQGF
jgi:hypothetical protein